MRNDVNKRPKRPGDLAAILAATPPPDQDFLQGVVLTMNLATGDNSVELAGGIVQTGCVVIGNPGDVPAGTPVFIVRVRRRYFILGPIAAYPAVLAPGQRIATEEIVSNSANITSTTHVQVASIVAGLITGRTYRVTAVMKADSSVAEDTSDVRLREDSTAGTEMDLIRVDIKDATGRWRGRLEAEYTAVADGDKTFVLTMNRATGTGNVILIASATVPSYLYVDFIRG